ncbi:glycosyltransferase family 2 protein [Solicola gregarius]|uniref:Glycosyltransferase family 2 protein n=1 Tax=Solicola gregarius TaxID=2908642 RepID=A0AA46TMX2_9ACTN|nr:glycosyltransferase family 2 protein [Solicola gregarius]UYM07879.1 glycosyltransferase family 2 protein [Solicola gregarius]
MPPTVAAVLVTHNGARWLPQTLAALGAQTFHAGSGIAVDVDSKDDTPALLSGTFHESLIVRVASGTGFGDAVRAGLDALPRTEWIWLLHDDCAPAPDALERLLDDALSTGADVVGPKLREWPTLRRLLEVGVSITGTGHRETGLERGEPDQGQHDRARDVLAVSSAGMLVRRDLWDALGGLDPELPLYFDDVDFGWRVARHGGRTRVVPRSVMFHAEASARSQRPTARRVHPSPRRDAREGALYTLLSNASLPGFCWQSVRLFVGSLLRVIGLVLVKAPGDARQELAALFSVYVRPWRILAARRRRAATSTVAPGDVRHLLPAWTIPYRHGIDEVGDVLWGFARTPDAESSGRRAMVVEYSHVADLDDEAEPDRGLVAFARRHPWACVVAALTVVSLVACWGLIGGGSLSGGALLPAPETTGAWWSTFAASWHDVGLGSDAFGPPYAFVLAALSVVTFGHPGLVVDVVVIGAVPLAALTAHRLARRFLSSGRLQIAWALAYAFAVVASGALGQGRFGTLLGLVLAPVVVNSSISLVQRSSLRRGWQEGLRVGLWLSLLTAFVPIAYALTIGGLVIAVGLRGRGREWLSLGLAAVVPFGVLGPWMWERALDPGLWWWEAGLADGGFGSLEPTVLDIALGQAGGPYAAPALFGVGLLAVGLAALIPARRRQAVLWAWLVALICLAFAVIGAGTTFEVPGISGETSAWVGFATVCWLTALAAGGAIALDGLGAGEGRALGRTLGVAGLVVGLSAPVLMAGWWVLHADGGAVGRGDPSDLPAYLAADAERTGGSVVVLDTADGAALTYSVHTDDGPRLGDESVMPATDANPDFATLVSALASDPTADDVEELAGYGVHAVYARPPVDESVTVAFDSAPGITPSGSSVPGSRVWMLESPADPPEGDGNALRPWIVAAELTVLVVVLVVATPGRRSRRRA